MIEKIEKFLKYLENSQKARTILLDLGMAFFIIFLSLLWLDHHKSKPILPIFHSSWIYLLFSLIFFSLLCEKILGIIKNFIFFLKTIFQEISKSDPSVPNEAIVAQNSNPAWMKILFFDVCIVGTFLTIFFYWFEKIKPGSTFDFTLLHAFLLPITVASFCSFLLLEINYLKKRLSKKEIRNKKIFEDLFLNKNVLEKNCFPNIILTKPICRAFFFSYHIVMKIYINLLFFMFLTAAKIKLLSKTKYFYLVLSSIMFFAWICLKYLITFKLLSNVGHWIFYFLGLLFVFLYVNRFSRKEITTSINIKYSKILLLVIVTLFVCLSSIRLNYHLIGDELFQFSSASGFIQTGKFEAINFITGDTFMRYDRSWPSTLIFAFFMNFFGNTPFSARLATLTFGAATIILSYIFVKKILKSNLFGLLIAFFIATNAWFIYYSTFVRMYIFLVFFSLLSIYFFYSFLGSSKNRLLNFIFTLIFFTISVLIHEVAFLMLPIFILIGLYNIITVSFQNNKPRRGINVIKVSLGIFFVLNILNYFLPYEIKRSIFPQSVYIKQNIFELKFNLAALRTFFDFDYGIALIIIVLPLYYIIYNNLIRNSRDIKSSRSFSGYQYLILIFFFSQIIFNLYVSSEQNEPRYMAPFFIANTILLILSFFITISIFTEYNFKKATVLTISFILIINVTFLLKDNSIVNLGQYNNIYNYKMVFEERNASLERPDFETANHIIRTVYKPGMPIVGYFIPIWSYYLKDGIYPPFNYFEMKQLGSFYSLKNINGGDRDLSIEDILNIKNNYNEGLIMWTDRKDYHLDNNLREFVKNNYKQLSGKGVDTSNISIYLWKN